jgi:hypothetical protein
MASARFRATPKFGANTMFKTILIATRDAHLPVGSAALPNHLVSGSRKGCFAAGAAHV